jgi:CBS domain-containing protein
MMIENPLTVQPEATIHEVLELMKSNRVGCVPVVKGKKLVGIVSEGDFMSLTGSLIGRFGRRKQQG